MKLVFTDKYTGLLLLLNGIVIAAAAYSYTRKKKRTMKFGNIELLEKVSGGNIIRAQLISTAVRVLAITILIVGLSNPVLVEEVKGAETDFIIALDNSASMFTSDVEPTRFDAAKKASESFVSSLGESSNVGLVTFAGSVNKSLELTNDRGETVEALESAGIGENAGTALGDAVSAAVSMLTGSSRARKVILVTDGKNNVGSSIEEAADYARRMNTTVNVVGIGSNSSNSEDYRIIDGENASKANFPNLNEEELRTLSNTTGGETSIVTSQEGIETAFSDLETVEHERELTTILVLIGVTLLVLESFLRTSDLSTIP